VVILLMAIGGYSIVVILNYFSYAIISYLRLFYLRSLYYILNYFKLLYLVQNHF